MADGDIHHRAIDRKWKSAYGLLCEDRLEVSEIGRRILHVLKNQIKEYGNAPIDMIDRLCVGIQQIQQKGGSFSEVYNFVDGEVRNMIMNCSPRGRDILREAINIVLVDIRHCKPIVNIKYEIVKTYIEQIYLKQFEDRIQKTRRHHKNASYEQVEFTKRKIRPHVNRGIDSLARQLTRSGTVSRLRQPKSLQRPNITVEDPAW